MTANRYENSPRSSCQRRCFQRRRLGAAAFARRRGRAGARGNPQVKLSLEQVALLEGRITEAKADALPDITWNTLAMRSRDPGLLNSPNFDAFPTEFRDALSPLPAQCLLDVGRSSPDALQFQARQGAGSRPHRAQRGRSRRAARASDDGARRDPRLQPAAVRHRAAARHSDATSSRSRATWTTRATAARPARRPSSKCCAPKSISRTSAPKRCAPRTRCPQRARLLNTVMLRPTTTPVDPTDTLAVVAVQRAVRRGGEGGAERARRSCSCCGSRSSSRRCWSTSRPATRSRASISTARTGLPCGARRICFNRISRDGRRR